MSYYVERLVEGQLMQLRESGCKEMWRKMQYKRRWERQNCCSLQEKCPHAANHNSGAFSQSFKSEFLQWHCSLLSDSFQPILHFFFPDFYFISNPQLCGDTELVCCTLFSSAVELGNMNTSWMLSTLYFHGCSKCISTASILNQHFPR